MGRTIRFTNSADFFRQGDGPNNLEVTLYMLAGNDRVRLDRDDELGGSNRAYMGRGNDRLWAIEGGNVFDLGDGDDTYFGAMSDHSFSRPSDKVNGGAGNDHFLTFTVKGHYMGGAGADRFVTLGWQNTYNGGPGRDAIVYSLGNDYSGDANLLVDLAAGRAVIAGSQHETLISIEDVTGTDDDDRIFGSATSNRLAGGEGIDQLTGRGGADTFIWRTADEAPAGNDGMDRVTDFRRAQGDRIDLRGMDANESTFDGNQVFTFIGRRAFSDRAGELSAIRKGADTILRGDTDGNGIADFQIRLVGITSLSASDLIL